ncbi:hypothetical protein [Sulfurimonas sp.]|uniref:hypothetical protein n=1 Tax=Sulfurimonas sp. TaxID=2022749 RepID=UPI00260D3788|nr:hypothetical protein [Sulfurimonas sp.]
MNSKNKTTTTEKKYEVIAYEDNIVFNFTLPGDDKENQLSKEVTLVWDDTLEKFFETHTKEKPYKIHSFKNEQEKSRLNEKYWGLNNHFFL